MTVDGADAVAVGHFPLHAAGFQRAAAARQANSSSRLRIFMIVGALHQLNRYFWSVLSETYGIAGESSILPLLNNPRPFVSVYSGITRLRG